MSIANDPGRSALDDVRSASERNCVEYADDAEVSAAADNLIVTMRRTTAAIQATLDTHARKYDLSSSKIMIIMTLAAAGDRRLAESELARQLELSPGNLSSLTASLENAGIVKRKTARDDRRVAHISLTVKGLGLVNSFAPEHFRSEAAAVSVLSAREQQTLIELLDKLRAHQ